MSQLNPILNTAFRAARKAGDFMIRASKNLPEIKIDHKTFNDFVSDVDRHAETIIVQTLQEAYPHHRITSEEMGSIGAADSEYEWIIDPLDGTANYLHGYPQYAISMALMEKGVLKEALVYAPERNDLYTASRGKGAELNGRRIRVSSRFDLPHCLVGTGFPSTEPPAIQEQYLNIFKDFLQKTAGIRHEGAASLDLCAIATGRFDGFFECHLKSWDIAAGALIVQEAGGIVTDFYGEQDWLNSGNVVAANPKMLAQMLKTISKHI